MKEKYCPGCRKHHPATVEVFGSNSSRPDGLAAVCKFARRCQRRKGPRKRKGKRVIKTVRLIPPANAPVSGSVYIFESAGAYKIGMSSDVDRRLAAIQAATPHPVVCTYTKRVSNMPVIERQLHALFRCQRIKNEWFDLTRRQLLEAVATLKAAT